MGEKIRVLRVLEYIGEREWVENTLSRSIKGTLIVDSKKGNLIKAATLGDFPEVLNREEIETLDEYIDRARQSRFDDVK